MKNFISIFLVLTLLFWTDRPASAQTPLPPDGPIYIVQTGDTLWGIAVRFNITVDNLVKANNLAGGEIYPGDRLLLPGFEDITGTFTARTIEYGESLRTILRQYQLEPAQTIKINRLTSPTELFVGANIILLQQEDQPIYTGRFNLNPNQTILEASVSEGSDPWTITAVNHLPGSWSGLPNDVLYVPGKAVSGSATGLPSIFGEVTVDPLPIIQGTTIKIQVESPVDAVFSGFLVDRPLHFFPTDDGRMIALQGVHALLDPGVYPLHIQAELSDGSEVSYEQNIIVVSGGYPEDPLLYVDAATIDPVVTEPEMDEILSYVSITTPERLWEGLFLTPASLYADSTYFTSRYGNRRVYVGIGTEAEILGFHTGLDFGGGVGLPITAPANGKIVFTGSLPVRGNATLIDHGWGIYSGFWHQSEILVQEGDTVERGQVIGLVGGTGRVTGAHLHWEIWVNGIQADPMQWLTNTIP